VAKPIEVTDDTFAGVVLESELPIVVDLWAAWCGPCKMIAPLLEQIADEYEGRLQVAKLDVDKNGRVPMEFGVQGIPTLLLFRGGQLVERIVGFMPKAKLLSKIEPHLAPAEPNA
jgi:thioredoxin 1